MVYLIFNYEEVLKCWKNIQKRPSKYLIISIDDFGWVRLEGTDALCQQDWADLEAEYQKFLEFQQKNDAYFPFRGKKNSEWQSPDDEEYYSDFLTEDEIVWNKKKF